jgi:hypothetical protein
MYNNHPICKYIYEIREIVSRRSRKTDARSILEIDPIVKRAAVDALAGYGKQSIPYLHEVIDSLGISDSLKAYILNKIAWINTISTSDS